MASFPCVRVRLSSKFALILFCIVTSIYFIVFISTKDCGDALDQPLLFRQHEIPSFSHDDEVSLEFDDYIPSETGEHAYPGIPSIISIGPEKSGTTSFAEILGQFPEIVLPSTSPISVALELRMWINPECANSDLNFTYLRMRSSFNERDSFKNKCSYKYYKHFWQVQFNDIRNQQQSPFAAQQDIEYKYYYYFEKSPAYWYYEHVAFIFKHFLIPSQRTKFCVLLRNPLHRLRSYFILQSSLHRVIVNHGFTDFIEQSMDNKYIKAMDALLPSVQSERTQHKLIRLWNGYIYRNSQNYLMLNGQFEYDTNPWFAVGASCYIVPLLMWLKYIPSQNIKLLQMEQVFDVKSDGQDKGRILDQFRLFRCWLSMDYEYDKTDSAQKLNMCIEDKETVDREISVNVSHSRNVSYLSAKPVYQLGNTLAVLKYKQFITNCNNALKQLLQTDKLKDVELTPFDWHLW